MSPRDRSHAQVVADALRKIHPELTAEAALREAKQRLLAREATRKET